eukprot:1035440-Prymnesium_polylepis.1
MRCELVGSAGAVRNPSNVNTSHRPFVCDSPRHAAGRARLSFNGADCSLTACPAPTSSCRAAAATAAS